MVTVNLLSIILFMRNSNLRTRGMYLVINLTVVDILVGGFSMIGLLLFLGTRCDSETNTRSTSAMYITSVFVFYWLPMTSLTYIAVISLDRLHATFLPFKHRVIQTWVYWVTLFIMTIVSLLIIWLPFAIGSFIYLTSNSIYSLYYLKNLNAQYPLLVLSYANLLVNPFIYTIRMPEFRKAL